MNQAALSEHAIAEGSHRILRRGRDCRQSDDAVNAALRHHSPVAAVSPVGYTTHDPWQEAPHISPYRRPEIEPWQERKGLDLAL